MIGGEDPHEAAGGGAVKLCRHGWDEAKQGQSCPQCVNPQRRPGVPLPGELTGRQSEVLEFLVERSVADGAMPRFRDIGEHFGISLNAVFGHVKALRRKGFLVGSEHRRLRLAAKAKREAEEVVQLRAENDRLEAKVKALELAVARMERIIKENME